MIINGKNCACCVFFQNKKHNICQKLKWLYCQTKHFTKIAAILKGIAAIFFSTKNIISPISCVAKCILLHSLKLTFCFKAVFIYVSAAHKPRFGCYCRSPPF